MKCNGGGGGVFGKTPNKAETLALSSAPLTSDAAQIPLCVSPCHWPTASKRFETASATDQQCLAGFRSAMFICGRCK